MSQNDADKAGPTRVIVTVEDDFVDKVDDVAKRLRASGLDVDQVLGMTGTITGSCHPGKVGALRRVKGVSAVEPEGQMGIPPGEDITA